MTTPRSLRTLLLVALCLATGATPIVHAAGKTSANGAIMAFLGDPVPVPSDMDPKYNAEGLTGAFVTACKLIGVRPQRVEIDDSEFPFHVYASFSDRIDTKALFEAIRSLPGYSYSGSTSGSGKNGDQSKMFIALSIVPINRLPRESVEAIQRRSTIRLQVLAARYQ